MERVRAQISAGAVCERAASGRRSDVYLGRFWRLYGGCFEIPRFDAQSRQQGRALRDFAALVPAGGRGWNLARRGADRDAKIEPMARKMTSVRRSHLMH